MFSQVGWLDRRELCSSRGRRQAGGPFPSTHSDGSSIGLMLGNGDGFDDLVVFVPALQVFPHMTCSGSNTGSDLPLR